MSVWNNMNVFPEQNLSLDGSIPMGVNPTMQPAPMPMIAPPPKKVIASHNKAVEKEQSAQQKILEKQQKEQESKYKQYMDLREKLIGNSMERAKLMNEGYTPQMDLTALAKLTDTWTGSDFTSSYKKPESFEDRQRLLQAIESQQNNQLGQMAGMEQRQAIHDDAMAMKDAIARVKSDSKGKGKTLTATETGNLANLKAQKSTLQDLYKNWNKTFKGSARLTSYIASKAYGSEADKYDDQRKLAAQAIGKALEGGKLTDVDYEKYMRMLPQPSDTEDQAQKKFANLKKVLDNKYSSSLEAFGQAGYNVEGFNAEKASKDQGFQAWKKSKGL